MWFKNLVLYRLLEPCQHSAEAIASKLGAHALRDCGPLEAFSYGWVPPLAEDFVHAGGGCIAFTACKEMRLLPPAVVREVLDEKVAEIEARDARPVRGKEKKRLRDDIYFELLPRAFTRRVNTSAYLAPDAGWLVVDASSVARAEDLVTLLRRSVDGLKLEQLQSNLPTTLLSEWLEKGTPPAPLGIGEDCELRDPGPEGAIVRCQREDLSSGEVLAHLRAGKQVHRLALSHGESLSFQLCADLSVKRVRFESVGELDEYDDLDEAARMDANFVYMTATLSPLLDLLLDSFGHAREA